MFAYGICPLATDPLASWLTDFRDWTGYRRAAFDVFRKNFSLARREHILEEGVNGVNRLATKGKKYYRLPTKREKNYRLPTGKLLTDY